MNPAKMPVTTRPAEGIDVLPKEMTILLLKIAVLLIS